MCNTLRTEAALLRKDVAGLGPEPEPDRIVTVYHRAMTVRSLVAALAGSGATCDCPDADFALEQLETTVHPALVSWLDSDIARRTSHLESFRPKNVQEIEQRASMYDRLRQMMSTREFLVQYQRSTDDS